MARETIVFTSEMLNMAAEEMTESGLEFSQIVMELCKTFPAMLVARWLVIQKGIPLDDHWEGEE